MSIVKKTENTQEFNHGALLRIVHQLQRDYKGSDEWPEVSLGLRYLEALARESRFLEFDEAFTRDKAAVFHKHPVFKELYHSVCRSLPSNPADPYHVTQTRRGVMLHSAAAGVSFFFSIASGQRAGDNVRRSNQLADMSDECAERQRCLNKANPAERRKHADLQRVKEEIDAERADEDVAFFTNGVMALFSGCFSLGNLAEAGHHLRKQLHKAEAHKHEEYTPARRDVVLAYAKALTRCMLAHHERHMDNDNYLLPG